MSDFPKLFIPGPTHVPDDILEIFSYPQIGHRTPEISELIDYIVLGVQDILYTKNDIYLMSHAATGLWEVGTKNSVKKGVLHAVNGAFSSKWALSSELNGFKCKIIDFEWGAGIDVAIVDKSLASGEYDVFAMVHNETSTGAMSDINVIGEVIKFCPLDMPKALQEICKAAVPVAQATAYLALTYFAKFFSNSKIFGP